MDKGGNYELRRAKNRFSAIFPKISILRHILLHKVKIHMHMAIKHILLYRNSEKSLQPSWAEIQKLSDPEKGCGRKCPYCINYKNAIVAKCFKHNLKRCKSPLTRIVND